MTLEEREALVRPIEESERRISAMRETIAETERSLREIGYLFMAEKHRLSDLFLERRKKFLRENLVAARAEANGEFRKNTPWVRSHDSGGRRCMRRKRLRRAAFFPGSRRNRRTRRTGVSQSGRALCEYRQRVSCEALGIENPGALPHAERPQLRERIPRGISLPLRGANQHCAAGFTAALPGRHRLLG